MKRRDVGSRIDRLADYIGLAPAIPGTAPRAGKTGPEVLAELRAIADVSAVPRSPAETFAIVERERRAWATKRPPEEEVVLTSLRKLAGSPAPAAFGSADAYAIGFAAWLEASDRDLAEKGARP